MNCRAAYHKAQPGDIAVYRCNVSEAWQVASVWGVNKRGTVHKLAAPSGAIVTAEDGQYYIIDGSRMPSNAVAALDEIAWMDINDIRSEVWRMQNAGQ